MSQQVILNCSTDCAKSLGIAPGTGTAKECIGCKADQDKKLQFRGSVNISVKRKKKKALSNCS